MVQESLFSKLGGELPIKKLVEDFYNIMENIPAAKTVRDLHPKQLDSSIEKLYEFLVGWSGGPPLYVEKYGHPRLRMRHLPFPIGEEERDQWMLCMRQAIEQQGFDENIKVKLESQFAHIADFMRNKT